MAVANQLTTIHSCDTVTDAITSCVLSSTSGGSFVTGGGEYVEGSAAYAFDLDVETHTVTFTPSSSLNLTNQVLWVWLKFITESFLDTWPNGGVKVRLDDGTNWSEWYLGGSGRWGSAWVRVPVHIGSTPDAVSGTLSTGAVTTIVFYFTAVTKSKLPENVFIDFLQYGAIGSGLKVTGGGLGTEETWSDVEGDDITAAVGMIEYVDGVYFLNGPITFGDTATNSIYFEDSNQILVTKDHYRSFTTGNRGTAESLVSSDHYEIKVQNYAAGTCNFQLGEVQGGRGVSGCIFKTGGNRKLSFDFNDTDIDILKLYGCLFIDCGTTVFPTVISGSVAADSTWNGCGVVTPSTFEFIYCNFVNASTYGITISSTSFDVTYSNFINPTSAGVQITATGTYPFTGLNFVGTGASGPYDVENTTAGLVTVQNGGDPISNAQHSNETGGGTTAFETTVSVSVHVIDEATVDVAGAQVWINKQTPDQYDSHASNNAQGDLTWETTTSLVDDIPAAGWLWVYDSSEGTEHHYRYASVSGTAFTLETKVGPYACSNAGSETTTLEDSVRDFTALDIEEGDTLRNETDGSWAIVLEVVDASTITHTPLQGGTNNYWTTSDNWSNNNLAVAYVAADYANTPILNDQTDSNGDVSASHNWQADRTIVIRVRKSSTGGTKYKPFSVTGTLDGTGYSNEVTLIEDTIAGS